MQVTRRGELVFDLDSTHKKPYEPLVIGQFIHKTGNIKPNDEIYPYKDSKKRNEEKEFLETVIPENQIICSVPCSLHSRKPPVNGTQDFYRAFRLDYKTT